MAQREFPASPLVGVGAVVFDEAGRVLLIERATEPHKGRLSIPGGLVELGEPVLDAVRREVAEETGLLVEPQAVIEVVDRIYTESEGQGSRVRYHYVVVDYWCRILGGEARSGSDAAGIVWAARSEWEFLGLEPVTVDVIEKGWELAQSAGVHA